MTSPRCSGHFDISQLPTTSIVFMLLASCFSCCPCTNVKISALRRKLWKAMLLTAPTHAPSPPQDAAKRCFLSGGWKTPPPPSGDVQDNSDLPALAHALLKHLTLAQMEQLAESVERGVTGHSDCLRLEERFVTLGRYGEVDIVQLVCRLFRWPKAPLNAPLVNFCDDEEVEKEMEVCVNPYHWSLTMDPPAPSSATSWKGKRETFAVTCFLSLAKSPLNSATARVFSFPEISPLSCRLAFQSRLFQVLPPSARLRPILLLSFSSQPACLARILLFDRHTALSDAG